jgi:hypothetical protein
VIVAQITAAMLAAGCQDRTADVTAEGTASDTPESAGRVTSALRQGSTYPPVQIAFVLVDTGGGVNLSIAAAQARISGPAAGGDPSVRGYYLEASYGSQEVNGQAYGPFPHVMAGCASADTNMMTALLRPMVDSAIGGSANHYLWYIGQPNALCTWGEYLAGIGTPDRPARDSWLNGAAGCLPAIKALGFNLGLQRSSSMSCGTTPFLDEPGGTCTQAINGDPYDAMGSACGHFNGWHKVESGWLQQCNAVRIRASGTFTLLPIELPCDGAQLLQVPMPRRRDYFPPGTSGGVLDPLTHYYLELRTSRGVDGALTSSVQVRVAGDLRGRSQRGLQTWILDMHPETATIDGLLAG